MAISDAHARRASLSAWFCYLRQNVGSCFATAPAIVVHDEQPEQFFKDLNELLGTGRLKRTFGGIEYAAPLSASWGAGDLRKLIAISRENSEERENLGLSPGLLAAFETVGLVDAAKPLKERIEESQTLVLSALDALENPRAHQLYISAEEMIRFLLLKRLQLTEKDLVEFENRPKEMIQSGLMLRVPGTGGGKGEACTTFYNQFDQARSAFKALADNALLKTWEYTLASFAETKPNFTTWNLYSSLGLQAEAKGGIGNCLYDVIKTKLEASNSKVREYQQDYEIAYNHLKYLEARVRSASSDKELQWIKMDYQAKRNEFDTFEEIRNREHFKAERFANLLNDLVDTYYELFPNYFQEVYDADMHEVSLGLYDDSPAGFRLLYKHGRTNTSQWSLIYNPQQYIEALSNFFIATETELKNMEKFKGLEEDLTEIITKVVTHIKTDEFLETAFYRMAQAHNAPLIKDPLENLDKIDKKPWSYTSGGSMSNLVSSYFRLEGKPTETSRWVENEMELLVFLIDVLKQMPAKVLEEMTTTPKKSVLMHSPTHAFTLKPGLPELKKATASDSFTYTWVRDTLFKARETMVEYLFLDEEMMGFLIEKFLPFVPFNFRHHFKNTFSVIHGKKNPREFRNFLVETMEHDRGLNIGGEPILNPDLIDSSLYSWLPLFSSGELKNRLEKILHAVPGIEKKHFEELDRLMEAILDRWEGVSLLTAEHLQDIAKAILLLFFKETAVPIDYHLHVACAAQKYGYAFPAPILFADTNWAKELFGFVVSPGSGNLELWRIDYTGTTGFPMSMWRQWLNGTRKDITWGVYNKPQEYLL